MRVKQVSESLAKGIIKGINSEITYEADGILDIAKAEKSYDLFKNRDSYSYKCGFSFSSSVLDEKIVRCVLSIEFIINGGDVSVNKELRIADSLYSWGDTGLLDFLNEVVVDHFGDEFGCLLVPESIVSDIDDADKLIKSIIDKIALELLNLQVAV